MDANKRELGGDCGRNSLASGEAGAKAAEKKVRILNEFGKNSRKLMFNDVGIPNLRHKKGTRLFAENEWRTSTCPILRLVAESRKNY